MTRTWNRIMRGAAALLLLPALMVFAAACGGDDDDEPVATATSDASVPATTGADVSAVPSGFQVVDAWVRATTNDVSAAYFIVKNPGPADRLVAVSTDITEKVQLHEVVTEGANSKMQEKPGGFEVPANGELELKPGGYHVMLMDLTEPLAVGDTVSLDLQFEKAGIVPVNAEVKAMAGGGMEGTGGGMHQ